MKDNLELLGRKVLETVEETHHVNVTTENYQYWLEKYFGFIGIKKPEINPLDLTISQAAKIHNKRPLWAQTFTEKGFKTRDLQQGRMTSFSAPETEDANSCIVERELVVDQRGKPALIERTLSATGLLTHLVVIHEADADGGFVYRAEERLGPGKYGNELRLTLKGVDLQALFEAGSFVAENVPEAKDHPSRLF